MRNVWDAGDLPPSLSRSLFLTLLLPHSPPPTIPVPLPHCPSPSSLHAPSLLAALRSQAPPGRKCVRLPPISWMAANVCFPRIIHGLLCEDGVRYLLPVAGCARLDVMCGLRPKAPPRASLRAPSEAPCGLGGEAGASRGYLEHAWGCRGPEAARAPFLFCQGVLGGHFGGTGLLGSSILNGLVIQRTRRGGGYRNRDDLLHGLYLGFVKDVAGQTVFDVAWGMSAEKSEMNDSLLTLWRDGCIYWQQRKTNWGCKVFTMKTLSWSGPGDYPTLETKMKGFQCKLVFLWVARPRLNSLACDVRGSLEAFSCSPPPSSRSRITEWRGGRAGAVSYTHLTLPTIRSV